MPMGASVLPATTVATQRAVTPICGATRLTVEHDGRTATSLRVMVGHSNITFHTLHSSQTAHLHSALHVDHPTRLVKEQSAFYPVYLHFLLHPQF